MAENLQQQDGPSDIDLLLEILADACEVAGSQECGVTNELLTTKHLFQYVNQMTPKMQQSIRKKLRNRFQTELRDELQSHDPHSSNTLEVAQGMHAVDSTLATRFRQRSYKYYIVHILQGNHDECRRHTLLNERREFAISTGMHSLNLPQSEVEQLVDHFIEQIGEDNLNLPESVE